MIRTDGPWFKDEHGRTLLLRGVNLGGSSKVPCTPDGATHLRDGFFDHRRVSFVGRPFPLQEADEHFRRLKHWGLTFIRLLTTWEAIEHEGPGRYDKAYLDYFEAIVRKAGEHGLRLFIDPHQDVWSRFSGGDGAPGWTLEAVGLDITRFKATDAAIVHQTHGDPFPRMIWPTNAFKLAAATMFTLFFGSDDFAPLTTVDGEPAREYLQRHYIEAVLQVARRLRGLDHVVGYDTLNEPLSGYIGWRDLKAPPSLLRQGLVPSPLQSMALGAGLTLDIERWEMTLLGARRRGSVHVNPHNERAWIDGRDCLWRQAGVWDVGPDGNPRLLRPDHFVCVDGRRISFAQDYYRPFADRFARAVQRESPGALIFLNHDPVGECPIWGEGDAPGMVYAPHWYDAYVLYLKRFNPWLAYDMQTGKLVAGRRAIRASFAAQLRHLKEDAAQRLGGVPTVLAEFGVAFDLGEGRAFRNDDFRAQARALERSFAAVEDNLLSCTLWNYTADNSNARGDQWNGEDLSIFSRDQQREASDLDCGGRALDAVVRPYARAVAGEPLQTSYDSGRRVFRFAFRHDPTCRAPTEIFLPTAYFGVGCRIEVSDGAAERDLEAQLLVYRHSDSQAVHQIVVRST